jgi:N-acetylmuramoyl-L-alanine amidase
VRLSAALVGTCVLAVAGPLMAQGRPDLRLERAEGSVTGIPVELGAGFAAVPTSLFETLGWSVARDGASLTLSVPGEIAIDLRIGSAYFRWDGIVLQLADAPYEARGTTYIPLQLLSDFFPRRLPDLYEFDGPNSTLRAGDPAARGSVPPARPDSDDAEPRTRPATAGGGTSARPTQPATPTPTRTPAQRTPTETPTTYDGVRVVYIDAGHGGADPGALGPDGIREKDVALGISNRLAAILRREPRLEVHMTREDDTFVEPWDRGEIATRAKGERPGIFVSIHANSFPTRRAARGFETYFLAEARTEHERRVAAIENAPFSARAREASPESQPELEFILRELDNHDHQHWSALLAELVQDELNDFHPGPDRGVKQGVLAVLTNAVMPSVLVEVGYLSNETEGRLIGEGAFHQNAAEGIAEAVIRFFERYPPGGGFGG